MKNPHKNSSSDITKVIIVIGLFLIIAAIGYYFAMRNDGHEQEITDTPTTQNPVAGTQNYTFAGVTFSYPEDWKTEPHFKVGTKTIVDVTLIPTQKLNDNDVIVIGGANLKCSNLDATYTCKEMKGVPVYTKSKVAPTLKVLNDVVASVK